MNSDELIRRLREATGYISFEGRFVTDPGTNKESHGMIPMVAAERIILEALPEPQTNEQMRERLAFVAGAKYAAQEYEDNGRFMMHWAEDESLKRYPAIAIVRPEPEVLRNTFVVGAVAGGTMARKLTGNTEWRAWLEAEIKQRYAKAEPGKEKEG